MPPPPTLREGGGTQGIKSSNVPPLAKYCTVVTGIRTSVNVKFPPGMWRRPGGGRRMGELEIDKRLKSSTSFQKFLQSLGESTNEALNS